VRERCAAPLKPSDARANGRYGRARVSAYAVELVDLADALLLDGLPFSRVVVVAATSLQLGEGGAS